MITEPVEPRRLRILRALKDKLEQIKTANGFYTNAGDHVALGKFRQGVDLRSSLPQIVLNVTRTTTVAEGLQINLPVVMQGLIFEDVEDPLAVAELVMADIERALFGGTFDQTLGGLIFDILIGEIEPVPREDGSQLAGLQVEVLLTYSRKPGEPDR
jgi:hypothetical protein